MRLEKSARNWRLTTSREEPCSEEIDIQVPTHLELATSLLATRGYRGGHHFGRIACARRHGIRGNRRSAAANGFICGYGGNVCLCALFGTSRQLAVTSTSSSAALLAALVAPLALGDPGRYAVLASIPPPLPRAYLPAGRHSQTGSSFPEFISKPVLKGFVFGLALTIMVASSQAHEHSQRSGKFLSSDVACAQITQRGEPLDLRSRSSSHCDLIPAERPCSAGAVRVGRAWCSGYWVCRFSASRHTA